MIIIRKKGHIGPYGPFVKETSSQGFSTLCDLHDVYIDVWHWNVGGARSPHRKGHIYGPFCNQTSIWGYSPIFS